MLAAVVMCSAVLAAGPDARLQAALALEQQGDDAQALHDVEALVREQPTWALARLEAGRLRLKRGDAVDQAELDLDVARSLAPENPRVHYLWGLLLEERGRRDQAALALCVALTLRPDFADARFRLAGLDLSAGRFSQAIEGLSTYVSKHPDATAAHLQLATALEKSGDAKGAEKELRALAAAPATRTVALGRLADLLLRLGRVAEAQTVRSTLDGPHRTMRPLQRSGR